MTGLALTTCGTAGAPTAPSPALVQECLLMLDLNATAPDGNER